MQIDIMIDSASRPDLLKITVESLRKNLKCSKPIRWLFHEAVLNETLSNQCLEYINNLAMFDVVHKQHNPQGEMVSIGTMLEKVNADLFIHWEDDHILVRELDLDLCTDIFKKCPKVNQLAFNKRQTMSDVSGWKKKEVEYEGYKLTVSPHWRISPAIWRMSWIKPRWKSIKGNNGHWLMNDLLQRVWKGHPENKTADSVIEVMGTFYLGPIGEHGYVEHMGKDRSGRA